jgi:pyrroline-5-carboxylate reductase
VTVRKNIVGCIGTGNIGSAILARLSKTYDPKLILAFDIDAGKTDILLREYGIGIASSPEELAREATVMIIAVKPDGVAPVLESIKERVTQDKVVVSIAAGVTLSSIEGILGHAARVVRVMPNMPALVGEGISVISPNRNVEGHLLKEVEHVFTHIGKVLVLPERLIDAVTGLSGSGPAYVFTFIQALADGGVKLGIPREASLLLAAQTVLGSARYLLETGEEPITLRGKVASPGGATIEGIHALERSGFSGIVMDAVEKAALKSRKLGEK